MAALRTSIAWCAAAYCCLWSATAVAQVPDEPSVWFSALQDDSVWALSDGFNDPHAPPSEWAESGAFTDPELYRVTDADPRALSEFRPYLDPYGQWYEDPQFGLVWVPARHVVGQHFAPYLTHGHWALDESGAWVWRSDFSFGRVVFHYGRWVLVAGVGWAWVPGYLYAPAWVLWRVPRRDGTYLGWTPLPPSFIWVNGAAVGLRFQALLPWVFCPSQYAFSRQVYQHRLRGRRHLERAARKTHPYPGTAQRRGPDPETLSVPAPQQPKTRVLPEPVPTRVKYPDRLLPQQIERATGRTPPRAQLPPAASRAPSGQRAPVVLPVRPRQAVPSKTVPSRTVRSDPDASGSRVERRAPIVQRPQGVVGTYPAPRASKPPAPADKPRARKVRPRGKKDVVESEAERRSGERRKAAVVGVRPRK